MPRRLRNPALAWTWVFTVPSTVFSRYVRWTQLCLWRFVLWSIHWGEIFLWLTHAGLGLLAIFTWGWRNSFKLCLLVTEDTRFGDMLNVLKEGNHVLTHLDQQDKLFSKSWMGEKIGGAPRSWKWPDGHRGLKLKQRLQLRLRYQGWDRLLQCFWTEQDQFKLLSTSYF